MVNPKGQVWDFPGFRDHFDVQVRNWLQQHNFWAQPGYSLGNIVQTYLHGDQCSKFFGFCLVFVFLGFHQPVFLLWHHHYKGCLPWLKIPFGPSEDYTPPYANPVFQNHFDFIIIIIIIVIIVRMSISDKLLLYLNMVLRSFGPCKLKSHGGCLLTDLEKP